MAYKQPQIGDHYHTPDRAYRHAAWVLTAIFTSRDGIEHARLTSVHDATESKTLALSVIADRSRFILEESARIAG